MEEPKKTRYVKKNTAGAITRSQEPKKVKRVSPVRKIKKEVGEESTDEEIEQEQMTDQDLQEFVSKYTSDIDAILASAHKLSKTQLTKSAPYQPKIPKTVVKRPRKVIDSPDIASIDGNLAKSDISTPYNLDEVKEIMNYLRGDQKKIKSDSWKLFFKKLYNYDPAGLPLNNIKTKVLERVDLLTKTHSIKLDREKE